MKKTSSLQFKVLDRAAPAALPARQAPRIARRDTHASLASPRKSAQPALAAGGEEEWKEF